MSSAARRNVCKYLNSTYSTRNLTVKVNTEKGLEVLICYLPHSEGLLGGLGQEAQEDADGVLGWDCKEVDIAGTRQAQQASVASSSESQKTTSYRRDSSVVFLGQGGLEKHPPPRS